MRLRSVHSTNVFLHVPEELQVRDEITTISANHTQPVLIFFLTGNPGLIAYYDEFLSLLADSKSITREDTCTVTETSTGSSSDCVIVGMSLGGFDVPMTGAASGSSSSAISKDERELCDSLCYPPEAEKKAVYDLKDQVTLCHQRVNYLAQQLVHSFPSTFDAPVEVILIGHSVGTYIALEIVRMQLEQSRAQHHQSTQPKNCSSGFRILSTILLTPTIIELSKSPSGKVAGPVLSNIPLFPSLIQLCSWGLAASLPRTWLRTLVSRITGMKNPSALDCTVTFLVTPGCVRQALHMARDELVEISEDKWDQDVWLATHSSQELWRSPTHYFWFAQNDHWVAEATRNRIVDARKTTHTVLVSDDGMVHAWCLEQSKTVATQVGIWIQDILANR